jgi:GNAT superfamily N-acetyltransferase
MDASLTMAQLPDSLYIANLTSRDAEVAYDFHQRIAAAQYSYLWARTEVEIKALISDGSLFGVWCGKDRQLVALCYSTLAENELTWEIGGLAVDDTVKNRGIGTILLQFTLAHTVVYQQPWNNGQKVIAHVHEVNDDPRGIIEKRGFRFVKRFEVPESANPPKWMKRNVEGKVVGDEFEFPPEALQGLIGWFDEDLARLMQQMTLDFGFGYSFNLDDFKSDLREISQSLIP